jgi:hypothetical protein
MHFLRADPKTVPKTLSIMTALVYIKPCIHFNIAAICGSILAINAFLVITGGRFGLPLDIRYHTSPYFRIAL